MPTKYKTKSKLTKSKGYPITNKNFSKANEEADIIEKKKYPKGYQKLKKLDKKLNKNEIMAHVPKKGKILVSKVVPKKLREEAAQHDADERTVLKRLSKKKKK